MSTSSSTQIASSLLFKRLSVSRPETHPFTPELQEQLSTQFKLFMTFFSESGISIKDRVNAYKSVVQDRFPEAQIKIIPNNHLELTIQAGKKTSVLKLYNPFGPEADSKHGKLKTRSGLFWKVQTLDLPLGISTLRPKDISMAIRVLFQHRTSPEARQELATYLVSCHGIFNKPISAEESGLFLNDIRPYVDPVHLLLELCKKQAKQLHFINEVGKQVFGSDSLTQQVCALSHADRLMIASSLIEKAELLDVCVQAQMDAEAIQKDLRSHLADMTLHLPHEYRYRSFLTRQGFLESLERLERSLTKLLGESLSQFSFIPSSVFRQPFEYETTGTPPKVRTCTLPYYVPAAEGFSYELKEVYKKTLGTLVTYVREKYDLGVVGFEGYVEPKIANKVIRDGNIPIELIPSLGLATHGMWTHLVGVLMYLESNGATKENAKSLLAGLIKPNPNYPSVLIWDFMMDLGLGQSTAPQRTPFFLNAFLLSRDSVLGQLARLVWEHAILQCQTCYLRPPSIEQVVGDQIIALSNVHSHGFRPEYEATQNHVFTILPTGDTEGYSIQV